MSSVSSTPPPLQAGQPPVLARPMVILINLQQKLDALDERIDALERDEDYHAREELCRKRAAMELAAFFRWRGSTPVELTESIDAEFLYWLYVCSEQFCPNVLQWQPLLFFRHCIEPVQWSGLDPLSVAPSGR